MKTAIFFIFLLQRQDKLKPQLKQLNRLIEIVEENN